MLFRTNSSCLFPIRKTGLFVLFLISAAWSSAMYAQGVSNVVRVEEDWTLKVNYPEHDTVAPQVMTVISPQANINSYYAALTINHRGLPDFAGGGLQLQVWNNDSPDKFTNFSNDAMLNDQEAEESVSWTQAMKIEGGVLTFEITNGNSLTWGHFGGGDDLRASVATSLSNLDQYSHAVSVKNSGVNYAANRVKSLTLDKVRLITATGETTEYSNPIVVYPKPQE